jgi:hypothetical protein
MLMIAGIPLNLTFSLREKEQGRFELLRMRGLNIGSALARS